jgi:hypothetical protein
MTLDKVGGVTRARTRNNGSVGFVIDKPDGLGGWTNTLSLNTDGNIIANNMFLYGGGVYGSKFYNTQGSGYMEVTQPSSNIVDFKFYTSVSVDPMVSFINNGDSVTLNSFGYSWLTYNASTNTSYPLGTYDCNSASFTNLKDGSDYYATRSWVNGRGFLTGSGVSASFTTADGRIVTVSNGLITQIV